MIFVATGTQFPFDRLIQYIDEWAQNHPNEQVKAQIGDGNYKPNYIQFDRFMGIDEYNQAISQAKLFISHAGMGNIISAKENSTPIIVVNRQASLGEHRNDHQTEGLEWMSQLPGVWTASSKEQLFGLLDQQENLVLNPIHNSSNSLSELTDFLSATIDQWT